jgi:hypothetical protein
MSFDLFLATFRDGAKAPADAAAARAVLERHRYDRRPQFGAHDVHLADGSHVEMYAKGLDCGGEPFRGVMFALGELSEAIASFIFEFSRAAGCVIVPPMEPPCVLLPREDLAAHLPAAMGNALRPIPVASGAELLVAPNGGYDGGRAYRDHVVRGSGCDPVSPHDAA